MSVDSLDKQWGCGKPGSNLHKMGSMVCDISDPCLRQSPIKVVVAVRHFRGCCLVTPSSLNALKPSKWLASMLSSYLVKLCGLDYPILCLVISTCFHDASVYCMSGDQVYVTLLCQLKNLFLYRLYQSHSAYNLSLLGFSIVVRFYFIFSVSQFSLQLFNGCRSLWCILG